MPDPEIDVLWHGRWVLQDLIAQFGPYMREQQKDTLYGLIAEIDRIRKLRAARVSQRIRARQKKRVQAIRREVI